MWKHIAIQFENERPGWRQWRTLSLICPKTHYIFEHIRLARAARAQFASPIRTLLTTLYVSVQMQI